MKTTLYTLN